ncbi:MAG: DNA-3-methyladenine glycosylase family protein [Opitutales bacterium]
MRQTPVEDVLHWSPWFRFAPPIALSADALAETLDGGQSFTWRPDASETGIWQGTFGRRAARLRLDSTGDLTGSLPVSENEIQAADSDIRALSTYLRAGRNWVATGDALPWRSDPVIAEALKAFPGLRLLDQPVGDTLLGFLCSSTRQIVQIQQSLALLAERYGPRVAPGMNALPDWQRLAGIEEGDLRACLLGYRARYVTATANCLADQTDWEKQLQSLSTHEARTFLMDLPGVGRKIADCVLLFGLGRLAVFPVDTWILRVLRERYGLADWKPHQLLRFAEVHFGPVAGYAQQLLFAQARRKRTGRGK